MHAFQMVLKSFKSSEFLDKNIKFEVRIVFSQEKSIFILKTVMSILNL